MDPLGNSIKLFILLTN